MEKRMSFSRQSGAAGPSDEVMQAVSMFRRGHKIMIKDRRDAALQVRVGQLTRRKVFDSILSKRKCMSGSPPHVICIFQTGMDKFLVN